MNSIELLNCAMQCLDGLCHLHKHGEQFFEDLRPKYIGKRWKSFEWILLDRLSDPSCAEQYQIIVLIENKDIYMSPQLFEPQINKRMVKCYDKAKADCWSLGLCILESGLLTSIQDVYNKNTGKINENTLNTYLDDFNHLHKQDNGLLCTIVENCLIIDENKRYTCCEMLKVLNQPQSENFNSSHNAGTISPNFKRGADNCSKVKVSKNNILMNYPNKGKISPHRYNNI